MSKSNMESKFRMNAEEAAKILEDLAASLRKGTVCLEQELEHMTLKPEGLIEVALKAGQKKGKEKLSLQLAWQQEAPVAEGGAGLKISAEEPKPKPAPVAEAKAKVEDKKPAPAATKAPAKIGKK